MTPITTFAGRTVAVFGLARSGIVSAEALIAGGARVACWDDVAGGRDAATKAGLPLVDLNTVDWSQFAALVLAPGVPLTHPVPHWTVTKAKAAGVEIIGDIELFFRERAKSAPDATVICITGTNGKSTTTALIAHILKEAGRDVQMGGNIGVGVLALAPPAHNRIHVLELSSFQIDLTPSLAPSIGVLLNITPDHLDRHGTMENYAAIKARILERAKTAILGIDDAYCNAILGTRVQHHRPTSLISDSDKGNADVFYRDGGLYHPEGTHLATLAGVASLRGAHNGQNAAAAFLACMSAGLTPASINAAMQTFPGLAHRMEQVGHIGKALVINDSKATNGDSTEKALASFAGDIYWIAGGVQKEGGIAPLAPYFSKVAKAYLIGKSSADFAATLEGRVPFEDAGTIEAALTAAVRDASASGAAEPIILLSPACASYDQYKSFEHRGDHFRSLAQATKGFRR